MKATSRATLCMVLSFSRALQMLWRLLSAEVGVHVTLISLDRSSPSLHTSQYVVPRDARKGWLT